MSEEDVRVLGEKDEFSQGRVIATGVVHLFKKWQDPVVVNVLLVGWLICTALLILAFVPVVFALAPTSHTFRSPTNDLDEHPKNIYFVKHENRTWTSRELCNIETVARRFPDYNIYSINLLNHDSENIAEIKLTNEIVGNSVKSKQSTSNLKSELSSEFSEIRKIVYLEVSIEKFFAKSLMSKKVKSMTSREKIEVAAKFQLIWDTPGIALEPLVVSQLDSLRDILDNRVETDAVARIQMENELEATSVPCQSFIGLVIARIARNGFEDRRTLLTQALLDACPSGTECKSVRIVNPIIGDTDNLNMCPVNHSLIDDNNNTL